MFSRMFWLSYRQSSLKLINNISRNKLSFWLCVCLSCSCLFLPSTQGMHTNLAAKMAAINLIVVVTAAAKLWMSPYHIALSMAKCNFVTAHHICAPLWWFRTILCLCSGTQHAHNQTFLFISLVFNVFFPIFLHSLEKWLQFFFVSYAQSKKTAVGTVCATLKGVKMQETYTKHENWISFSVWIFVLHSFSVMLLPEIGINSTEGKMENTCK